MQLRRATLADYAALVRIADDNVRDNPQAVSRQQGFLTGRFTEEKFAAMNANLGIVVADDAGTLAGFLCATTRDFSGHAPIVRALLEACEQVTFGSRRLGDWKLFIYGPVCVAAVYRGRGLLKKLFEELKREMAGRYEAGVAFVDRENHHSLRAHVQSLGMTVVGEFEFQSRRYHLLAFRSAF